MLILAGALLEHAEDLLRMGLSPTEVIEGYEMASQKALDILPSKTKSPVHKVSSDAESCKCTNYVCDLVYLRMG